jgi:hypothetical protein
MVAVMIGAGPHKASHTGGVISAAQEPLGEVRVRASAVQADLGAVHAGNRRIYTATEGRFLARVAGTPGGMRLNTLGIRPGWLGGLR